MASERVYVMEMIPSGWVVLTDPAQENFHGIACIKGRWITGSKENWAHDRPVYVPVAHIKTITVYESVDEYFEAGKRSRLAGFPKGDDASPPQ